MLPTADAYFLQARQFVVAQILSCTAHPRGDDKVIYFP